MIPFNQIPQNIRVPLFYAEVDPSNANNATAVQRTLLIGQMTASGDATANNPVLVVSPDRAKARFGPGSHLALMVAAYRLNDPFGELWCLPLADAGAAVAAAGSTRFTHIATAAGTFTQYVGGQRVQMPVTATQTLPQLATAWAAAINAVTDLPVTAAVDGTDNTKVNTTAKNAGAAGNDIDTRMNYLGNAGGENTPAGLTVTIVGLTGGATNPTLDTALANCADQPFDFVAMPYTDTTSLNAIKSFLDDISGRWSWNRQVYGGAFTTYRGTVGTRTTLGTGRNDPHASIMGFKDSPTTNWEWAGALVGAAAASLRIDPARPLQTLPLKGVKAPPPASRDTLTDRNSLLYAGISTYTVDTDGTVRIDNLITTYQVNTFGQPDDSFLQVETLYTLAFVLRDLAGLVTSKYARKKLAANGTRLAPGNNVITPNIIRADLIARYRELEEQKGIVQDSDTFAAGLIVEKNASNPSRVDVLWPGTLVSGLRIFALLAQFRL